MLGGALVIRARFSSYSTRPRIAIDDLTDRSAVGLMVSDGHADRRFTFTLPEGARQGRHGRWLIADLHLKLSLRQLHEDRPEGLNGNPLVDVTVAIQDSFVINALLGPNPDGSAHLEAIDLVHGHQAVDYKDLSSIDLSVANYFQQIGVRGGRNEFRVIINSASAAGGFEVVDAVLSPATAILSSRSGPEPIHVRGQRHIDAAAGVPVPVRFTVEGDDARRDLPVEVKAIPTDPDIEVVNPAVLAPEQGGKRAGEATVIVRSPGRHRLVIAAHSSFNDPYLPVDITVR